jgi:hypothetical protein
MAMLTEFHEVDNPWMIWGNTDPFSFKIAPETTPVANDTLKPGVDG